jgi:hypothetical protein
MPLDIVLQYVVCLACILFLSLDIQSHPLTDPFSLSNKKSGSSSQQVPHWGLTHSSHDLGQAVPIIMPLDIVLQYLSCLTCFLFSIFSISSHIHSLIHSVFQTKSQDHLRSKFHTLRDSFVELGSIGTIHFSKILPTNESFGSFH